MKKKLIMIPIILIVLVIGIYSMIYFNKSYFKETKNEDVIVSSSTITEDITTENKEEVNNTTTKKFEDTSKKETSKKKENEKIIKNSNDNKNKIKETTDSTVIQEVKTQNKNSEEQVKEQEVKQETTTKKSGPWEKWGMTEDEYYNKPVHKWERVDFSSMNDCLKYGDNYQPYLDGKVSYNCREITSASGKFLGVMFDVEKLN